MNLDLAETTREGSENGFPKTLAKLNSPSSALYRPSEVASAIRLEEVRSIFVVILNWLEIFLTPSEKDRCATIYNYTKICSFKDDLFSDLLVLQAWCSKKLQGQLA